jgi:NAD(P)-dependent dehydrogenase (short-subunit alcohol dehydrogenase family)
VTTVDLRGAGVVITGGTRGLGLALGLEFGRAGATVFLTHRWGSVDEGELQAGFEAEGLPAPRIVESDASDPAATRDLMRVVLESGVPLAALVSNVAFAQVVGDIRDLKRASLELSLRYSTWPVLEMLHAAREVLGRYPRHVVAISTDGSAVCHPGYDMVGVAKAALETLCRYLALHLRVRGRPGQRPPLRATGYGQPAGDVRRGHREHVGPVRQSVDGPSLRGARVRRAVQRAHGRHHGQVITVDEGASLLSPVMYMTGKGWPGPFHPAAPSGTDEVRRVAGRRP